LIVILSFKEFFVMVTVALACGKHPEMLGEGTMLNLNELLSGWAFAFALLTETEEAEACMVNALNEATAMSANATRANPLNQRVNNFCIA
jgi:hypothetical protein